ncbi:MAG: hypothetical protein KF749_03010 [Bacteroidetes bacterium]|nr:hypothetical protein [Bacteroidota bacterium]MCW5896786.1 hypothetical protein [Bacteroidota bacterium]
MFKSILLIFLLLSTTPLCHAGTGENTSLTITHYTWDITLDYDTPLLSASCQMSVKNLSETEVVEIPILLYRLLRVTSVTGDHSVSLSFTQHIQPFEDWNTMHVNVVRVRLKQSLLPQETTSITLIYEGILHGYEETGMLYVRDNISPQFTILRPDCKAYPELGYPSAATNRRFPRQSFDYRIRVTIPDSLVAVNGGAFVSREDRNGQSTFMFTNLKKAWRMDVAIAKYRELSDGKMKVCYLEKDSVGATMVLRYMKRTIALFSSWWGPLRDFQSFSIIEIPNGYGSQADVSSILQTAAAFNDSTELRQMYHELSHLWNVKLNEISPRWEEGLASFVEYLTIEKLEHRAYLDYVTAWYLDHFKKKLSTDKELRMTPMCDFGAKAMTDHAYSLGMIAFRVLYEIVGESKFHRIVRELYQRYSGSASTTKAFANLASEVSNVDLSGFFNDWFFTTNYVSTLEKANDFSGIVRHYK